MTKMSVVLSTDIRQGQCIHTPVWDHLQRQLPPQRWSKSLSPENDYQEGGATERVCIKRCFFGASLLVLHVVSSKSAVRALSLSGSHSGWRDLPVFFIEAVNKGELIFLPKSLCSDRSNLLCGQVSHTEWYTVHSDPYTSLYPEEQRKPTHFQTDTPPSREVHNHSLCHVTTS